MVHQNNYKYLDHLSVPANQQIRLCLESLGDQMDHDHLFALEFELDFCTSPQCELVVLADLLG
ncbi:MAG: hypothetical protein ACK56F_25060, partial [bacterium]